MFSVHWNTSQVTHYLSPLLGVRGVQDGGGEGIEREASKITWITVQTGALGKSHTKASSQAVPAEDPKSISPPGSEAPFPLLALYL